ncbi:hypothetical protein F53441_8952 [Fusarium austroafricanum]|uniref:Uncharacterized protein n=1 Tax=Fusarium austroafricanum TaxID=2364996 RepID=A0A8H4NTV0_9HYPO|nr:hypothetical protein F53441_8952 [Fusarium austroafricanum]
MDPEKGEEVPRMSKFSKVKKPSPLKKILLGFLLLVCLLAVMFGMGVLGATYAEMKLFSHDNFIHVGSSVPHREHSVARRDEAVDASYPISTKTALSTIYGVSYTTTPEVVTEIETVTGTTYVTVPGEVQVSVSVTTLEATSEYCEIEVVTMTESYTITISNDRVSQDSSAEATDVTVTDSPSTVTETRTDISVTSGRPDGIVTARPETVTTTGTDFSLTGGPYTTVVIPDLYPSSKGLSTVTQITTIENTLTAPQSFVTVTLTSSCPECTPALLTSACPDCIPVFPTSTWTQTVYETAGEASTSTTTIQVPAPAYPPYPTANNTMLPGPSGSVTFVPTVPTPTPVIISGGTKKPEPRGWGGTSGTTNLSCTVMLLAIIMFVL